MAMKIVADFHIHSPYSRAVSKDMTLENLDSWARLKGITVVGTGDFTHPKWIQEIKTKLEPAEEGLYVLKPEIPASPAGRRNPKPETNPHSQIPNSKTRFILTVEISSIYSKSGKTRRIHNIIFMPSVASAEKFNAVLGWRGNLKSDGRPILGLDAKELAKIAFDTDSRAVVVPAHCLLSGTLIHTKPDFLTPIDQITEGDEVYTHEGRWRAVEKILKRPYSGKIFSIKPYYFRQGLTTTPEHPFYAIKTKKNCHWSNGICKPAHEKDSSCTKKHYRSYAPQWIPASSIEVGDVLVFPRFRHMYDNHAVVDIQEFARKEIVIGSESVVRGGGTRSVALPRMIPIDKNFCRLVGYFLAEGYVNGRDAIGFTFHSKEKEYIRDVATLVQNIFGETLQPVYRDLHGNGTEIIFYSKILQEFFSNFCYESSSHSAATKTIPLWILGLKTELQVEIFRGWWRGDKGYTVSRTLMNQLKIILLRIGIIPSVYEERQDDHRRRGNHIFEGREIFARHSLYSMARLSFFEDPFGLLQEPEFAHFRAASPVRHGWMDEKYVYLPVRDIDIGHYNGEVYNLEVADDNSYTTEFATVHNCWTPWFSVFGSMSGFNSLDECFDEYAKHIFAIETGLSSDPAMNWRWSHLDRIALLSNSDSHSLQKIGREANVFELLDLSYSSLMEAIRSKDPKRFLYTIEFFPEEGKYHYDGHRACGVSFSPEETKKVKKICPKCGKPLTVGVMYRVDELADRPVGGRPDRVIPFKSLVPLDEIIGESLDLGASSKRVKEEYKKLVERLGTEFAVLVDASDSDLEGATTPEIAEGIRRVREGKLHIEPGYDGEYGVVKIFTASERKEISTQTSLF